MSRLSELTDYRNIIITRLTSDQEILKAVYHNHLNFLSMPDVLVEDVMYKNIFPFYYVPGIDEKMKSYINISLTDYRKAGNVKFKAGRILIYVITHKELFRTDYGCLRTDYLVSKIDHLFDGKRGIGLGELEFMGMREVVINEHFLGNCLEYRPVDFG